ncbi:trypsin-like serine peptidase [Derxia lacustris]|uniref:trypsin-like serine peptidase n=1 Tax=Derxia lacustris TaxID=764842 RepID=UPI00111BDEE5|nr:hypothetical protein [Derxia lacustris]
MKPRALLLAALALGLAAPAPAADIAAHDAATGEAAIAAYWTAARMKAARPYSPRQAPRAKLVTGDATTTAASAGLPQTTAGHTPLAAEPPVNERLFDAATQARRPQAAASSGATAQDWGTVKAPFSTRRADIGFARIERVYPWRTVGKLYFSYAGIDYECSAAVIQRRIILTAGHCVHEGSGGSAGWHDNFVFVPGFDGANDAESAIAPWGRWTGGHAITTAAWLNGGGEVPNAGDYAVIEIADRAVASGGPLRRLGELTGWLATQTLSLGLNHTTKLGYPSNFASGLKLIESTSANYQRVYPNNVEYGSDLSHGSSGGPWVQNFAVAVSDTDGSGLKGGSNRVVGVTSYGYDGGTLRVQGASILDSNFTAMFNSICAHQTGNCK